MIKKYNESGYGLSRLELDDFGKWCKWEDVVSLIAERDELKKENKGLKNCVEFLTNTSESIRACIKMTEKDNEKLREERNKYKQNWLYNKPILRIPEEE